MRIPRLSTIEWVIIASIAGAVAFVVLGAIGQASHRNVSLGPLGLVEERCIGGYKFVLDQNGVARQIIDEVGKGIKCDAIR